jgi:hypothetical protein
MTTKESIVSVPMKKFFEYMKQLPQFMWDHAVSTREILRALEGNA